MPVNDRQRVLLQILESSGGQITRLRLVKLAFLVAQESQVARPAARYDFVPYHYGPFSFTLYHELNKLAQQGTLRLTDHDVALADKLGARLGCLPTGMAIEVDALVRREKPKATAAIVEEVYKQHRYYTINSKDASRRATRPGPAPLRIYTAGYEGRTIEGLLNVLLRAGISHLIDIRANPVARRYGFHKATLEHVSQAVGIQYTPMPDLGIPSPYRVALRTHADYGRLLRWYAESLRDSAGAVDEAIDLILAAPSVMLCKEADSNYCHRRVLAVHIEQRTGLQIVEV